MKMWHAISLGLFVHTAIQAQTDLNAQKGFIHNHGVVNPADYGLSFTNEGIRDLTVSAGQLSGVDPETGEPITNPQNLIPIKAQSIDSATTIQSASNIVAGGTFIGDGSGLSNLNINAFGEISTSILPTSGVWDAENVTIKNLTLENITGDLSAMKDLTYNGKAVERVFEIMQQQIQMIYGADASVQVETGNNAVSNGLALIAAYNEAKTMNPSASNRVAVIIPSGRYDIGATGLVLNTPYINLIGAPIAPLTKKSTITRTINGVVYVAGRTVSSGVNPETVIFGSGEFKQTANHMLIENLTLECLYTPTAAFNGLVMRHIRFVGGMTQTIEYAGYYEDCVAGDNAFGKVNSTLSGMFIDCLAGSHSFGGNGSVLSGYFKGCSAYDYTFGHYGTASGVFIECYSNMGGFAPKGTASGIFIRCTGNYGCFGGWGGIASGYFESCLDMAESFGGRNSSHPIGSISGTFINCRSGNSSFGSGGSTWSTNTVIQNCSGGANSFGPFNTAAKSFSYNSDAHMFMGSPVTGDGSGLTNINASAISGTISSSQLPPGYGGGGTTNPAIWGYISGTLTNQQDLITALNAKMNNVTLASVATSGNYADLANKPVLSPIATNAVFSNLTVPDGAITQAKVNGLSNALASKADTGAATNVFSGEMTVQGAFIATFIPPQGDISMGSYTNRNSQ